MKSTMKNSNHPTPQPSGRTAEKILAEYCDYVRAECNGCWAPNCPALNKGKAIEAQRQLFNAMLEIVKADLKHEVCADLIKGLRVFFNQPENGGK